MTFCLALITTYDVQPHGGRVCVVRPARVASLVLGHGALHQQFGRADSAEVRHQRHAAPRRVVADLLEGRMGDWD